MADQVRTRIVAFVWATYSGSHLLSWPSKRMGDVMERDDKNQGKSVLNITFGKETDSAFADVLRGLLKGPAEELGKLFTDVIGFSLSDRMRRKRLQNVQAGLSETKEILGANSIDLKDITPPREEELHVVLEGMSLSADDHIRKLWSGLLASALSDSQGNGIGRPITSTISSLSPADARIIEFAAYITKEHREFQKDARIAAGVEPRRVISLADSSRIEKAMEAMNERREETYERAVRLRESLSLVEIGAKDDWHQNLERLGLIVANPGSARRTVSPPSIRGRSVDMNDLANLANYAKSRAEEAETLAINGFDFEYIAKFDQIRKSVRLGLQFKPFGETFCKACGLL